MTRSDQAGKDEGGTVFYHGVGRVLKVMCSDLDQFPTSFFVFNYIFVYSPINTGAWEGHDPLCPLSSTPVLDSFTGGVTVSY